MFYPLGFIIVWVVVLVASRRNPYSKDPFCIGRIVGESMENRSYEFSQGCDLEPLAKPYKNFPPSLLIIGVQKAGTTALTYFLRRHTAMDIGCSKELHFLKFRPDVFGDKYSPSSAFLKYESLMCNHSGPIIDASPAVFSFGNLFIQNLIYSTKGRLRKLPKMVFMMRDPLTRAYSLYNMQLRHRHGKPAKKVTSFDGLMEYDLNTFEGLIGYDLYKLRKCGMDINLDDPNFDPRVFYSDDLLWCYHDPENNYNKVLVLGLYSWFLEMLRRSGNPNRVLVACAMDFGMENELFTHMVADFVGVDMFKSNRGREMLPNQKTRQKSCPKAYRKEHNLTVSPKLEKSLHYFYSKWNRVLIEDFGINCGWPRKLC